MPDNDKAVIFLLPDGTKVSNDPRHHEEKLMEKLLAKQAYSGHAMPDVKPDNVETSDSDAPPLGENEPQEKALDDMTGKELKAKVTQLSEQGIQVDMTGIKLKSELVNAIQKAMADQDNEDEDDEDEDEGQSDTSDKSDQSK